MPIYEYQCSECKNVIEKLFKIQEKPQDFTEECPSCHKVTKFELIFSPTAISYNGVNHAAKVPSFLKDRFNQIRKHYPNMQSTV